ncbi:G patch domain-containing protein 1 homolog [Leptidea sinapis]|uniref:G patch domain-containing protein 1 homolog n=1 Tax=Leptidea sinapis TaxID=189913 RepID=UPI0021448A77|nr:G patch domain-containing protein 1 homolog [Leptidea sinapis]
MSSSDSDDENIVRYGTPLEPFEEDEIPSKRKFQEPSDQYAVDAHGRRRFHGAFTGGFSAGYGNTVGTLEGWTPSSFKSSRSEKAQLANRRPEDFMDDEDRGEFGIAPKHVQTHGEFSGQKRSRPAVVSQGPIPGEPVLKQLLRPVHETAAVRMLKAMGWREGQGTGARLRKREKKKAKEEHRVYGCYIPKELREHNQQHSDDSSESEFEYDTLFAPDDYEPYVLQHKSNRFGLGYSGLSRHSVLGNLAGEYGEKETRSHLIMKDKGRRVSIRGHAFGVGAFEVDDEDIYAVEDMSHYDFTLGDSDKKPTKKTVKTSNSVLPGFVKATKPFPPVPSYPPPMLPRGYVPAPAGNKRTRFDATTAKQRDQGLGRHELTPKARGELLGETPFTPGQAIKQNEEVTRETSTTSSIKIIDFTTAAKVKDVATPTTAENDFISIKDSGKDFKPVFKPFASDPKKQSRYESYLQDKNSLERDGSIDNVSKWERDREMLEFEQAAKLYRPLSGVMGDRFTHALLPDDALNPLTAVARSSTDYGLVTAEQIAAAEKGAFGVMTRRKTEWRPESLVCKRFNVPEPGGERKEPKKDEKAKVSYSIFSYMESSVHDKDSFTQEQSKFSGSKSIASVSTRADKPPEKVPETINKRMTVAELFMKEAEKDLEKTEGVKVEETIEKFDKMDLYKAIFLSDSEEEGNDFVDAPKNVERNTSPPRGIFANIDFDEINSWRRSDDKNTAGSNTGNSEEKTKVDGDGEKSKDDHVNDKTKTSDALEEYGPKIPENFQRSENPVEIRPKFRSKDERKYSSSSDSWVDVTELKPKKHKKKSKKNKSKHKKSKHKKKDR